MKPQRETFADALAGAVLCTIVTWPVVWHVAAGSPPTDPPPSTQPQQEHDPMAHAAAIKTAHSVSTPLTADGQVQDRTPANLTGAGYITGFEFDAADGDTFVLHDVNGSGAVLLDVRLGVQAREMALLPPDQWVRYTSGCYLDLTVAGSGRAVLYYRAD